MSKEYLEALENLLKQQLVKPDKYYKTIGSIASLGQVITIKQALQRLESIDNANPSEALEWLEELGKMIIFTDEETFESKTLEEVMPNYYKTIKQALLKAQEQEKVLEIIKEYQVDIWLLKQCDYENYIRIRKEALISVGQVVNENGNILEDEITKEEFDTVKRWVE